MALLNIMNAKLLLTCNTYDHIKYPYINSVTFNSNLLLEYCLGFEAYDIDQRNQFLKTLYTIYVSNITDPHILSIKEKIIQLQYSYPPFASFIDFCTVMKMHMDILHDMTFDISKILINHNLHIYGRFLPRLLNGLVSKNKIEVVSVLVNENEKMKSFIHEISKKFTCMLLLSGPIIFLIIRGVKLLFKFTISNKPINIYIENTVDNEQLYVNSLCCINYTKKYLTASNELIDLGTYNYTGIYKMLNVYYESTNSLKDVWHDKITMKKDLLTIIGNLSRQCRETIYTEHY